MLPLRRLKVFLDPKQLKKSFKNRIQIVLYLLFSMFINVFLIFYVKCLYKFNK